MATLLRENSESIKEEVEKMKVGVVTAIIICSISGKTINMCEADLVFGNPLVVT